MDPAVHTRLVVLDILIVEELLQLDSFDRIDRTHKIALIAKRNSGVDTHAAFEAGVGGGPFPFTGGHAFSGHEGLSASAGQRIDDVCLRIDAGGQTPHDVVHIVGVGVFAYGNGNP